MRNPVDAVTKHKKGSKAVLHGPRDEITTCLIMCTQLLNYYLSNALNRSNNRYFSLREPRVSELQPDISTMTESELFPRIPIIQITIPVKRIPEAVFSSQRAFYFGI